MILLHRKVINPHPFTHLAPQTEEFENLMKYAVACRAVFLVELRNQNLMELAAMHLCAQACHVDFRVHYLIPTQRQILVPGHICVMALDAHYLVKYHTLQVA